MPAVGLGFLCVLLLVVIIVLCVKHKQETYQIQSGNNNMSMERDMLQSRNNIMAAERDALQSKCDIMRIEKERLLNFNNILTSARNQLQSSYNTLKSEMDAMQKKICLRYKIYQTSRDEFIALTFFLLKIIVHMDGQGFCPAVTSSPSMQNPGSGADRTA